MEYGVEKAHNKSRKLDVKEIQLFFIFFSMVVIYAMHSSMSVAIIAMTDADQNNANINILNWDPSEKSIILSSVFLGILITQIPSHYIARIVNAKKFLCLGLFINGFIYAMTPFIVEIGWILFVCSRLISGLFQGCVTPCIRNLLALWTSPLERKRSGSLILSGSQIGVVIAMSVSGVIDGSKMGWQNIFYIFGSISMLWAIIFYCIGLESSSDYLNNMNTSKIKIQEVPWKEMLSSKAMWSLIIVTCGQNWYFYLLLTQLPTYIKYVLHYDIQQTGIFTAIPYLIMWILGLFIWWLDNFVIRNKISRANSRKINSTIGSCGPAIVLLVLCLVEINDKLVNLLMLTLIIALNAAVNYGHLINHMDLSLIFHRDIITITTAVGHVFSCLGPIACGLIVKDLENIKQWQIIFYITAIILFFTNLTFILFGEAEEQYWSDLSYLRYRNRGCRISTISAAYNITLKGVTPNAKTDSESELTNNDEKQFL